MPTSNIFPSRIVADLTPGGDKVVRVTRSIETLPGQYSTVSEGPATPADAAAVKAIVGEDIVKYTEQVAKYGLETAEALARAATAEDLLARAQATAGDVASLLVHKITDPEAALAETLATMADVYNRLREIVGDLAPLPPLPTEAPANGD